MKIESEARETAYRFVVYTAVGFSLTAIIAVFITLPLAHQYISGVHQRVQNEMEFCIFSLKEVMMEMGEAEHQPVSLAPPNPLGFAWLNSGSTGNGTSARAKRQARGKPRPAPDGGAGGYGGGAGCGGTAAAFPACPVQPVLQAVTVCPDGLDLLVPQASMDESQRQQGEPGEQGLAGEEGREGQRGEPGRPAISTPALPGDAGATGETGPSGLPGAPGTPGRPGAEGLPGPQGPPGATGKTGPIGAVGETGQRGAPGQPGERGICPKYCALDGGVFFEDGTRRKR